MKRLLIGLLLAAASPAVAQGTAAPAAPQVEPQRLALATQAVNYVWPLGTYARMMNGKMDELMNTMMASMFDMKMGDFAKADGKGRVDPKVAEMTMRQAIAAADPHFEERMRITTKVMTEEMIPLMSRIEPDLRAGLARAYAAKFTAEQLTDMNRFFATPSGRTYAGESMMLLMDPELMSQVGKFAPMMMEAMPGIIKKMNAATAHLPPPPKRASDTEAEAEEEQPVTS